jgi:DNA-binding LacI/PurR family transcriptional regulator
MADVAERAGVSAQTVSRVSNGHTNVDAATRDRVLAAMRDLGYRPNGAARALKRGSFNTIGVIVFNLMSVGNLRSLDAVSDAASLAGYSLNFVPVAHPTPADVSLAFSGLTDHAVDGIIVIIESHLLRASEFDLPAGLPIVIMDSIARDDLPIIDNDQHLGARQATEHLLNLGHSTVWHIAGPPRSISSIQREESWRAALLAAGSPVPEVLYGDWSADSGYRHGRTLSAIEDVTAIFAANDQMALGAMRAFHEAGRPVPGQVSVVGFDDGDDSANFWPPLTTIHQDFTELGRRAVSALIGEMKHEPHPIHSEPVPTRLVVRESTAPPPRS